MRLFLLLILLPGVSPITAIRAAAPVAMREPPCPLVWDALEKTRAAQPGDRTATFEFSVTNTAAEPVEILHLQPSCTCTSTAMPRQPWIVSPGAKSSFTATVDFEGKQGRFSKTLLVESSHGSQTLIVTVNIPEMDAAARRRNQELAQANRQAVFQSDCATCHASPLIGKTGPELYRVACAICHESAARATMVPDLLVAQGPRDAGYWRKWVTEGKDGTLMPAFSKARGGPLTSGQIDLLVAFLTANFSSAPSSSVPAPTP